MTAEHHQVGFAAGNSVLVVIVLSLTYVLTKIVYNIYFHPLSNIPGLGSWSCSRLPFIWAILRGQIVHDIEKMHQKYGPILRIAPNEVTFASKEAWGDIHQPRPNHRPFLKDPLWWSSQPGHPNSIINAIKPEVHARIRKVLAPGLTLRALRNQEPFLQRYVNLLVERLKDQTNSDQSAEVDISPWFNYTTLDIFGDLRFGESFECLEHSRYHPWIALLFSSAKAAGFIVSARFYPWIHFLLMKCIPPSLKKVQGEHYQQIVDKVNRRLNWELDRPDLMSRVIQHGPGETGLEPGEISATFMVLTTAGSETTATTLCGTMNYLIAYREKLTILTTEIHSSFQNIEEITLSAVQGLPYLNAVINEALRLCPAIPWILPRIVPEGGASVCGTWLPGGTPVSIQAWTFNRDSRYFHDSSSFEPERWLSEASNNLNSPYYQDQRQAIEPFSTGPRNCMGQNLAWAEMRLILSKLLFTFDVEAVKGKQFRWEDLGAFLLVEKRPMYVRLRARPGWSEIGRKP